MKSIDSITDAAETMLRRALTGITTILIPIGNVAQKMGFEDCRDLRSAFNEIGRIAGKYSQGGEADKIKSFFKIWNKLSKQYEAVYSRAYHDVTEFHSPEAARHSNVHGVYQNEEVYEIHEFERTDKRVE